MSDLHKRLEEARTEDDVARPLEEWGEDDGTVLWWKLDNDGNPTEAPYVGTPLDCGRTVEVHSFMRTIQHGDVPGPIFRTNVGGWPGYHTHWTPLPKPSRRAATHKGNGE